MNLHEVYERYSNFTNYRNERLHSADEQNAETRLQIQELEIEKKQQQLEYEKRINDLKSQLVTTTEKNRLNQELNLEKAELKNTLHNMIAEQYHKGSKPTDIATHLGLGSTTLIYQAIKNRDADTGQSTSGWDSVEWTYFDNTAIHRFAVSDCGNYVKVHGNGDSYRIIEANTLEHLAGDSQIKANSKRIKTALEMFHGTFEGEYLRAENPYTNR